MARSFLLVRMSKDVTDVLSRMGDDKYLPGEGWYGIIIRCNNKLSMLDPEYRILQIKEKFGTLRYYYHTNTNIYAIKEAMDRYVRQAELESAVTCEVCGNPGSLLGRRSGWMKTRCLDCSDANMKKVELF